MVNGFVVKTGLSARYWPPRGKGENRERYADDDDDDGSRVRRTAKN